MIQSIELAFDALYQIILPIFLVLGVGFVLGLYVFGPCLVFSSFTTSDVGAAEAGQIGYFYRRPRPGQHACAGINQDGPYPHHVRPAVGRTGPAGLFAGGQPCPQSDSAAESGSRATDTTDTGDTTRQR